MAHGVVLCCLLCFAYVSAGNEIMSSDMNDMTQVKGRQLQSCTDFRMKSYRLASTQAPACLLACPRSEGVYLVSNDWYRDARQCAKRFRS